MRTRIIKTIFQPMIVELGFPALGKVSAARTAVRSTGLKVSIIFGKF